jgi:hypothetical protein
VRADSAVAADAERMVAETLKLFGTLDVSCANAGIFPRAELRDLPSAQREQDPPGRSRTVSQGRSFVSDSRRARPQPRAPEDRPLLDATAAGEALLHHIP